MICPLSVRSLFYSVRLILSLVTFFYEYFLNPKSSAISLKQCRHKLIPYLLIIAPNRPHRSHFFLAIPAVLSFGLLCLIHLALIAGFLLNCFNIFLQSLAVMFKLFLHCVIVE